MREKLLQYIWQFQYFNRSGLTTTAGDAIQVIHQGNLNLHQGADFSEARIRIGGTVWAGNVELHVRSGDWHLHHHSEDKNYHNIILHVVWEQDKPVQDISGNNLPTLVLQNRVSKFLLGKYEDLMNTASFIPCENHDHIINPLVLLNWKQRLLAERLEDRATTIFSFLQQNNFHWEETLWWLLAKNFGIKINVDAFEKIARSVPLQLLAKHKNQIHQLEALLFGQAGLLDKAFTEAYPLMLQKEYRFYSRKYDLQKPEVQLLFLRMRPANFPTIRLAQLAMLISKSSHLFSKIIGEKDLPAVKKLLDVTANDYWHYHYVFEETAEFNPKKLGGQMIDNIVINTVVPLLFAYGVHHNEQLCKERAISWLETLTPEKNRITDGFTKLRFTSSNAFDSQAYIHLKNNYCDHKRCLQCVIGNALLTTTALADPAN